MTPAVDLNAYLARIGQAGAVRPTLETLRELVALHARAIPFESRLPRRKSCGEVQRMRGCAR